MSLKSSLNIPELTLEDIRKVAALEDTMPIFINWVADIAAASTGALQFLFAVDLALQEATWRAVITGANCLMHSDGNFQMLDIAAAGDVHVWGRIAIWDDEPYSDASFYYDDDHADLTDEFAYASSEASLCLMQWNFYNHVVDSADSVMSFAHMSMPDGRPSIIPAYPVKDNKLHLSFEMNKSNATKQIIKLWGTVVLWVKWIPITQAQLIDTTFKELSNR